MIINVFYIDVYVKVAPLNSQVAVAAATVASWFPTPTPLREACVARVPDRELEKAWKLKKTSVWQLRVPKVQHCR